MFSVLQDNFPKEMFAQIRAQQDDDEITMDDYLYVAELLLDNADYLDDIDDCMDDLD
eukprot:CAMPEP_0202963948 /NCGR_PEP_ID=MMETSP1396-20130829/8012_1 /ASSEMBLY_ACC=CAM_ASM_000872 /TAXON_ID= /ORGANISM="Pseudokeronopsis sp., Strain Brazil" /LENGTH=56 /DNA_ID=CAMNT_0049685639 /DNA_START=165 /DNA_END=332 /DNA_ORIENTATION=+